ncbi:Oxidation resistance protein 1 [Morella rubra]|uniref:Oxidation resistance protein 1 n=1 Tax=Morella rubra TaxID=262757 RepID=A0A6A1VBX9_9ROSI|nr:Oxidation resistance protein 1 [Morella rubra]
MGRQQSLRNKAVHFVSDLTTVFLNPISDKPSKPQLHPSPPTEDVNVSERSQLESISEEGSADVVDGPDTSSFTAFLYSLLSSSESGDNSKSDGQNKDIVESGNLESDTAMKESAGKKSLLSRGRQSIGRVIYKAARIGGYRNQDHKGDSDIKADGDDAGFAGVEMRHMQNEKESVDLVKVPDISEPSLLLSDKTRNILYASLPALVQGRQWLLLYSTWRHGISLSTLYRRSMLWPGLSLLVVGDRKGAVFGGLVEAPLRPTNKRKYQGTNTTFVFTNKSGHPVIYHPTGVNRYFTLCHTDYLAIGGGGHFALYLDGDLLSGSSSLSDTYGNPCLANSEDFEVKEVELWGFVYASKYEEILSLSRMEAPGICRW